MTATTSPIADRVAAAVEAAQLPDTLTAFVGGGWLPAGGGAPEPVLDPGTDQPIARFVPTDADGVAAAVEGAAAAQRVWWGMAPAERGRVLHRIAERILAERELLALLESIDCGKPLSQATADITVTARFFEYYAGLADKIEGATIPQAPGTFVYTVREPFGVVAHITPWNSPVSQMARGVAPCLAAGNSVVVKPSELTPLTTLLTARLMLDAGLPPGVCNVVLGYGATTGAALTAHPSVGHITFTGSVEAGRAVGTVAAQRIIGCNLELGGKSPTIVCADADLAAASAAVAAAVVRNSGQACFATTRVLVDRRVHDDLVERTVARMAGLSSGHGLEDPDVGPLISGRQRDRVLGFIDSARAAGAQVVVGGQGPETGNLVPPTLLTSVTNDMDVARSEIFGPVQSIMVFDDLDEAVAIANDTEYGLSAGIFTRDVGVAHSVAARLQAGQVQVNRYAGSGVEVPFGGYKNSGIGREKGIEAVTHYTQVKSVIVATA